MLDGAWGSPSLPLPDAPAPMDVNDSQPADEPIPDAGVFHDVEEDDYMVDELGNDHEMDNAMEGSDTRTHEVETSMTGPNPSSSAAGPDETVNQKCLKKFVEQNNDGNEERKAMREQILQKVRLIRQGVQGYSEPTVARHTSADP